MSRIHASMARAIVLAPALLLTVGISESAAGDRFFRRARRPALTVVQPVPIVTVVRPVPIARRIDPVYGDRFGTFYPTPAVGVVGNYPNGVGYSPLGTYNNSMSEIGPFSSFRTTTAPVATYTRGYDGVVRPAESISTSYPMLPQLSPLAYPTRANYYYAPRIRDNPASESAINWLDQN